MRVSIVGTVLIIALIASGLTASPATAQTSAPASEWNVVYYPSDAKPGQMESGTFEVSRDVFRFRSSNAQYAWTVEFGRVEDIRIEQFAGLFGPVSSVVIETTESGRRVKRRVSIGDARSLNDRVMFSGLIQLRLQQFRDGRAGSR